MNPCLLIPVFDHGATVGAVIEGLVPLGLPCIAIDDGSGPETREVLDALEATRPRVRVLRRGRNGGRGAALKLGYRAALDAGFTHAIQLDADGQHAPGDAAALLAAAQSHPGALVLGEPRFDADAPRARLYGRWISRFWVWVETLSLAVRDPLCGFRCLPLAPTVRILDRVPCGDRMDFDPEIVVRLVWEGVPVVNVLTRVRYFEDGLSHFDMFADNARLSWLHTRLFFGMLPRLPRLLARGA